MGGKTRTGFSSSGLLIFSKPMRTGAIMERRRRFFSSGHIRKDFCRSTRTVIDGLVLEHIRERGLMDGLEIAEDKFWLGESRAFMEILGNLKGILKFYPAHMQREEKEFFYAGMEYFSEEEQMDMLREFAEFDRNLIHEKYIRMADQYEGFLSPSEYGGRTIKNILQPEVVPLADRKPEVEE